MDSYKVEEAERYPKGRALQAREWESDAKQGVTAGPVDLQVRPADVLIKWGA